MSLFPFRTILITGPSRSGTTLFGQILSTAKDIEYFYEPAMLYRLLFSRAYIEDPTYKDLLKTYVERDLMYSRLAGRHINFNSNDDSYIFLSKDLVEVNELLSRSWGEIELYKRSKLKTCLIKIPDVPLSENFNQLTSFFSEILLTKRSPVDIIISTINKGWFSEEALQISYTDNLEVSARNGRTFFLPLWTKGIEEEFMNASEAERAVLCVYTCISKAQFAHSKTLDYEILIQKPNYAFELMEELKLIPTTKTHEVLAKVNHKQSHSIADLKGVLRPRYENMLRQLLDSYKLA